MDSFFPPLTRRSHHHIWWMAIILFSPHVSRSEHKVLPFNMFITQFSVKWSARLNKALSFNYPNSRVIFLHIQLSTVFVFAFICLVPVSFRVLSAASQSLKSSWKLFITQLVSTDCVHGCRMRATSVCQQARSVWIWLSMIWQVYGKFYEFTFSMARI